MSEHSYAPPAPWAEMAAFRWYMCAIETAVIEAYMVETPTSDYSEIRDALQAALDRIRQISRELADQQDVTNCVYPFCPKGERCVPCEDERPLETS